MSCISFSLCNRFLQLFICKFTKNIYTCKVISKIILRTGNYTSKNRHKYYLKCHLIFDCKYRKPLLQYGLDIVVKQLFQKISESSEFSIDIMETDKDHIHLLISYPPSISVTSIVRKLKQESVHHLWLHYYSFLKKEFWKEHTFWSDGYFVCSIGEANPDTIRKYIENQGQQRFIPKAKDLLGFLANFLFIKIKPSC